MPSPPITATTLYLRNSTTVDSGAGIDVRHLDDNHAGADNSTQVVTATNANDNVERTFDPASSINTVLDARNLQRLGWAITLAEFTPSDSRCKGYLPAGNCTVTSIVAASWDGVPVGVNPVDGLVVRASLWRYNPSTDAGTLIASGASAATNWGSAESGTQKAPSVTVSYSATTFENGETLLLQVGLNTGTLADPAVGSNNYSFSLTIDTASASRLVFNTTSLRNRCFDSQNCRGSGACTESARTRVSRTAPAQGRGTKAALIRKAAVSLAGQGRPTKTARVRKTLTARADGRATRTQRTRVSQSRQAVGTATESARVRLSRTAEAVGESDFSRQWDAFRSDTAEGVGEGSFERSVIFVRSASVAGVGRVTTRISLDIEDLPDAGEGGTIVVRKFFPIFED